MVIALKYTGMLLLVSYAAQLHAGRFCFELAENYYEQLFCEVQSLQPGAVTVTFNDFRKNDESMQALLLKRPASRLGINVAMPAKSNKQPTEKFSPAVQVPRKSIENINYGGSNIQTMAQQKQCNYISTGTLQCNEGNYVFVKNKLNHQLENGALATDNQLNLPDFTGDIDNEAHTSAYVLDAYQIYLGKMIDIGLAEKTMSLGKFSYFFQDITRKGVAFNQRFEVMFTFLKKDKQSLGVSPSKSAPESVDTQNCIQVSDKIYSCNTGSKNILFARQNA